MIGARLSYYRFHSTWRIGAPRARVYRMLSDIEGYPAWWSEIKAARRTDESRADVLVRSILPYSLRLGLHTEIADEHAGILRSRISGDLEGWSSWSIAEVGGSCLAEFEEEVVAMKPLMRAFSPVARPLFRFNHALMMRNGERGLRLHCRRTEAQ